ncbi:MAG TPA: universal stress protein, partial [Pyrinomonadaceae bacterium]|nr:universal stress protein [Pyrinomonadaceae bacterium]
MINIKRILCPTDLSQESDEALRYAVALARRYQARLFLLYCAPEASAALATRASGDGIIGSRKAVFKDSLAAHLGLSSFEELNWEGITVESDYPAHEIAHAAATRGVDLIVMRSRRRPISAALLGS